MAQGLQVVNTSRSGYNVGEGAYRVSQGDNWGYLQAGAGAVGLGANTLAVALSPELNVLGSGGGGAQYFISDGVRRSLSSLQGGLDDVPATIVRSGQPDVTTRIPLNQLFSPKAEVPLDSRFLGIQPPIRQPVIVQPLGAPGQPSSIPLNQVRMIPPGSQ